MVLVVVSWAVELAARGKPQCDPRPTDAEWVLGVIIYWGPSVAAVGCILLLGVLLVLLVRRSARSPEWWIFGGTVTTGAAAWWLVVSAAFACLV